MSGRSHRQQWRRLSVIEPNDNELPGQTNAANGRTRSTRASQRFGTLPQITVGSAGRIPSRLVCETNLPEGRDRKIPTDLNQKTKTAMKAPKNAMRPVADAMNFEVKRLER